MDAFVLDVSACMPWCCEDEATAAAEQLLQRAALRHPLYVPSLWPWEMMNALGVAVRRKRIQPVHAASFLGLLSNFDFHVADGPDIADLPRLSALASAISSRLTTPPILTWPNGTLYPSRRLTMTYKRLL
jgi:hypothetical protein